MTDNLGRCDGREDIIGSEVAMVDCSAGDDENVGGAGCDEMVESIMCESRGQVGADRGSVAGIRQPSLARCGRRIC